MFSFGTIVLIPFPFTDLTSSKVRPALIISKENKKLEDVVVAFISSKIVPHQLTINKDDKIFSESGLKISSTIRFDKIATLSKKIILGELGYISQEYLQSRKSIFLENFGFHTSLPK